MAAIFDIAVKIRRRILMQLCRVLLLTVTLSCAGALSQEPLTREFLWDLTEEEKNAVSDRFAPDIARLGYFAKPGRIEIYGFETAVLDDEGNVVTPDPSREAPRSPLQLESTTVLGESFKRRDEELTLVYALPFINHIRFPPTRGELAIHGLGNGIDYVVVYEIDKDKILAPADDSPVNPIPPSPEQLRRWEAYRTHMAEVNRRFGIEESIE